MCDCFQPFFIHSLLSHPCVTPASQAPRDSRGQRHGRSLYPNLPELTTWKNLQFLLRASLAQGISSSVSLYVAHLTFSSLFSSCKIIKKIYTRDEGKMAGNLSFSPRHTLCLLFKHTRLGFHWVDGPQIWLFFFFPEFCHVKSCEM